MITACEVARLALDLSKATFDNTFTTVSIVQGWAEDGARWLVRTVPLVPEPLRAVVDESVGLLERTRGDLKQTVDRCYRIVADAIAADAPDVATNAAPAPVTPTRLGRAS